MSARRRPASRNRVTAATQAPGNAAVNPGHHDVWKTPAPEVAHGLADEGWWNFGKIGRPHGVRGGVHLHLENPEGDVLSPGMAVRLDAPGRDLRLFEIEEIYGPNLVRFVHIAHRDAAAALRGAQVAVHRDDFPPPADDEAYLVDLIGAEVEHVDGRYLGRLEAFDTGGPQILASVRVELDEGPPRKVEFPFAPGLVVGIDDEAGIVTVDPPWGLFEGEPEEA